MLCIHHNCVRSHDLEILTVSRQVHSNDVGADVVGSRDPILRIMAFGKCLSIAMVTITSRRIADNFDISVKLNGSGVFTKRLAI